MRTFFIFKIKKELTILTKETPYNLYKTIDNLYYMDSYNTGVSFSMYENIFNKINKEYLNKRIYNIFKNNRYYNYDINKNIHIIDNKYKPEYTTLSVHNGYIVIKTNIIHPTLLFNYLMSDNLFVCDFKNKDYFWLDELVR